MGLSNIDITNYTITEVLSLFQEIHIQNNPNSNVNFMSNQYTLNDVQECKSQLKIYLNNLSGSNVRNNTKFLQNAEKMLVGRLMNQSDSPNAIKIGSSRMNEVQNMSEIKVEMNQYENILNIDTQYLPLISGDAVLDIENNNDIHVNLNEESYKTKELMLNSLQMQYSFYGVSSAKCNNYFYMDGVKVELEDGNYTNSTIVDYLNELVSGFLTFTYNTAKNKIEVQSDGGDVELVFYRSRDTSNFNFNSECNEVENNPRNTLGWMLGFKDLGDIDPSNNDNMTISVIVSDSEKTTAPYCADVYRTKYVILCVDDYNKNENNTSLIEIDKSIKFIKPTTYAFDSGNNNANCLTCDDINTSYSKNDNSNKLTKAEKYTQIELLKHKEMIKHKYISQNYIHPNNVLALIPIDYNNVSFGDMITVDVYEQKFMKSNRKYYNPVKLSKLKITFLDDKGHKINFNGCDWNLSLLTKNIA